MHMYVYVLDMYMCICILFVGVFGGLYVCLLCLYVCWRGEGRGKEEVNF